MRTRRQEQTVETSGICQEFSGGTRGGKAANAGNAPLSGDEPLTGGRAVKF